jgi:thiazole synthase
MSTSDSLSIAGVTLGSRLFLGTAGYPNQRILVEAIAASGSEVVTMSIRRISLSTARLRHNLLKAIAFCRTPPAATARDVLTAELAREALVSTGSRSR